VRGTDVHEELPAGRFSTWLVQLAGDQVDVPCGDCTACCTSSQFVHIGPEEKETLARIPRALLFPAPGLPKGHVVMGYDERGHCPMLVEGACSIYPHRPRTCRTYDCRVFTAAGIEPGDPARVKITERVRRWRFDAGDEELQSAVRAAAGFLRGNARRLPVPGNPTQLAYLAARIHDLFLDGATPSLATVEARLSSP
jgi:uncharacterized protein